MKLVVRITLTIAAAVLLFTIVTSLFLYSRLSKTYEERSKEQVRQMQSIVSERIEIMNSGLSSEMEQLAGSLFSENEETLASLMSEPPGFNTEVIGFAGRLQRRTTLDFLTIVSREGMILSSSEKPALYGTPYPYHDLPSDEPSILPESPLRLALRKKAVFGKRELYLSGGYLIKDEIQKIPPAGLKMSIAEPPLKHSGQTERITAVIPIMNYHGSPAGEIVISAPQETLQTEKRELIRYSIILIVLSTAGCIAAGHLMSVRITRPIRSLTEAAQLMAGGDLDARVQADESGEIGELMNAFNNMADRLDENRKRLIQTEKIAAWQEIGRYLAHEIKNPLTPIRTSITNLKLCLEKAPDRFAEIFPESSKSILEEVEKLKRLADEFSRFARLPSPSFQTADLNDVIRKTLLLYSDSGVQIEFFPATVPVVSADTEQMSQVIHNLVQNAIQASSDCGGRDHPEAGNEGTASAPSPLAYAIRITTSHDPSTREVIMGIEDRGSGMNEEVKRQIFTPYFTTRKTGTGLGLAVVHRIISDHKGSIFVYSNPGEGTRFEIHLPAL